MFSGSGQSSNSLCLSRKASICLSFSSGLKVQVEYIIYPPSHTAEAHLSSMSLWAARQLSIIFFPQALMMSGSFLNIPSPLQGASIITLSKNEGNAEAILSGDSFSTTAFLRPKSSTFFKSAFVLDALMSFVTRMPFPLSAAPTWVLFPPGAAHTSSTLSPSLTSAAAPVDMALGSCK